MSRTSMMNRNQRRHAKQSSAEGNGKSGPHDAEFGVLHSVRQLSSDVTRSMKSRAKDFGETATIVFDKGREKARDLKQSVEERVQERPLTSLLAATGLGLLIGVIYGRRR